MTDHPFLLQISLIVLVILDLLSAATLAAFQKASLFRILGQREQPLTEVNRSLALLASPARLEASLSLALMSSRLLVAGLVLILYLPRIERIKTEAAILILLLITGLLLYLLEWLAGWIARRDPGTWALRLNGYAAAIQWITYPLLFVFLKMFGETEGGPENAVTETELMNLVEAGQQEGLLEQDEQKMIVSIMRLGDTLVREIMVPRIDILALDVNTPIPQAIDALIESGHSRVPVYRDGVDSVLGVLYAKDLLRMHRAGHQISSLEDLLRPAYFVPEAKNVDVLMAELQAQHIHIAIVVDEFGGVAGLVTLEDIVEEIVGEIQDEYDQMEESLFQAVSENEFAFHGRIDLDDFNELMGTDLPREEADTLGGFIFSHIGRVPVAGDKVQLDHAELTIEQVSGQRIRKVRALRLGPKRSGSHEPGPAEDNGESNSDTKG